uniref:Ribonuclease H-like domain-containing protein n=1 Tax=Tanacetum cinerariifolium TaxID=118510 RepID=A0A6L2M1D1_TANCI|nr:ribonuclease H-like domain-containing protein [Tanacetum cinerariifolium]
MTTANDAFNGVACVMFRMKVLTKRKKLKRFFTIGIRACREALNKKKRLLHARSVCYKKIDQDSTYMVAASKVHMLKPGVETTIAPTTTEEKSQRRLKLKARNTLLIGIPNEHQLKFNSIKDAKSLLQAVEKRFGGNVATKKTQRNLLKQQYENFTASSLKMAMLTMRAKRFLKDTERKFSMNGNETIGFDKSMVECYKCHKKGHFVRECRAPRSQDTKHKESTRRIVPVETPASTALLVRLVKKPVVETSEVKASEDKPKDVRKNCGSSLIKDWISDSEDEAESKSKIEKKTVKPSFAKIKFVKPKEQVKYPRKTTIKKGDQNRLNTHNPRGNQRN